MKNVKLEAKLSDEVMAFIACRKSLHLASVDQAGEPYASYAPFAIGDNCLYILISDIAVHAVNLRLNPIASVLIVEDEDSAGELFARIRVNYKVSAQLLAVDTPEWTAGIDSLVARHGSRSQSLSELADFKLFKLVPKSGRYVKGFGRAYQLAGESLAGESIDHLQDGHQKRDVA
ncbi:heme utilization protein HutZ [Simiduia litorea]|uniref:HugZ family pyridoxamine 5'-phosphate oxidase n=1 Tax=Simiduia litorea TaxID=1435348 RepID=UPI0036F246E2